MINIRDITPVLRIGILDLPAFSATNGITLKREQEKAGARFVIENLLGNSDFKMSYSEHNKPFIDQHGAHISISHSHDKLVVLLNTEQNTGVDIELIREKVLTVRHKFVNEQETGFVKDDVEKLITLWAAKEALYKCYGLKNLDFKTNLLIEDFDSEVFLGKIETDGFKKQLRLKKEKIDGYILVYVLSEITDQTQTREI